MNFLSGYLFNNLSIFSSKHIPLNLPDIMDKTIWFVDVRSEIFDNNKLLNYFKEQKVVTTKKDLGNGFKIYKFE